MKDDFEDDEVWRLLGHARRVTASPYFSRRVLREIRQVPSRSSLPPFLLRWLPVGALAVLTAGFFLNLSSLHSPAAANDTEFNALFDTLAGMDSIATVEEIQFSSSILDF